VGGSYFFTHVLVVLSHFMSVSFLQSAFVVGAVAVAAFAAGAVGAASVAAGGASAANAAGATPASPKPRRLRAKADLARHPDRASTSACTPCKSEALELNTRLCSVVTSSLVPEETAGKARNGMSGSGPFLPFTTAKSFGCNQHESTNAIPYRVKSDLCVKLCRQSCVMRASGPV
jgi:hypothetical protein